MAQVLATYAVLEMQSMCRIKDGRQCSYQRGCKSITQQVSNEQCEGHCRCSQDRWHDILCGRRAGTLVKQDQQRGKDKENTENSEIMHGNCHRKRRGAQQEANAAYQHARSRMTPVQNVSQVTSKNRARHAREHDHRSREETCLPRSQTKRIFLLQIGRQKDNVYPQHKEGEYLHHNQYHQRLDAQQGSKLSKDTRGNVQCMRWLL